MQLINHEGGGDVREFSKASIKSGSSIENKGASNFMETNKKRVAVVNSGADKSMGYCSHGGCRNRFTDSSKAPELVVRGTC